MNILAIDPSYTRTGLALIYQDDNGEIKIRVDSPKNGGACYHDISQNHKACESIWDAITMIAVGVQDIDVIIEYPALATRSGAYLAILNGFLASRLRRWYKARDIYWIPPTACNSFTKNKTKTKTHLVNYVKEHFNRKENHDIATALIFTDLYKSILSKKYNNSFFIDKYEDRKEPNNTI